MMKKLIHIGLLVLALMFQCCTKNFEEINTNKNKFYTVEINDIFSGTVSRTMNFIAEVNYNKLINFSRYAVIGFATNPSQDLGDSYFNQSYVGIIRDLLKLEREYTGNEEFANRLAIVKTWKSYLFYMLASMYGSIPMSDALADGTENKRNYKYDSEAEIYTQILSDLKTATELINTNSPYPNDLLLADPVFGGESFGRSDLAKWQKFAHTLRLNIALHVQNLSPELAREHAMEVLNDESKLISSLDDMVRLRWGSDASQSASYYFTRFIKNQTNFSEMTYPAISEYLAIYLFSYNDPRIQAYCRTSNELAPDNTLPMLYTDTLTRAHEHFCTLIDCPDYEEHQADGLNNRRRDSILVDYSMPYVPLPELNSLAFGWEWAMVPGHDYRYSDPLRKSSPYNFSFVQDQFVKEDGNMILLNWADACFLKAEAEMLYGSEGKAQQYYEDGIRASFAQYGLSAEVDDYLAREGIAWNTNGRGYADRRMLYRANIQGEGGPQNHLEQIYKQRYFAGFFNCLEGWNLERRTRVLRFPPFFANGAASDVDGFNSTYNYWTERFIYPLVEQSKNGEEYYRGIENLKAVSPFYRMDRWGDNVYTSLGFAKLNPDLAFADMVYSGNKQIAPNCEYYNKKYGQTYEEVVSTAQQLTGETDEQLALKEAFNYAFRQRLNTYIPQ